MSGFESSENRYIKGTTDVGVSKRVPATQEGFLQVAIAAPRLPFGSVHTENMVPVFQTDAVYGLNLGQVLPGSSLSGTASAANSLFICSTGTTVNALSFIQGRKRLRYRAGQGVVARFTAIYDTPVDNSYQVVGVGHAEDGVFFGYKGTLFGVLYNSHGVREEQTLTVTTGATGAGNVTITLNGVAFLVAVTASSNIQRTVWEISQGVFAGWTTQPVGATVIFVSDSVGAKSGAFTFSAGSTGSAATITETLSGANVTELFVPQTEWNGDKLDGTGASGVTLNTLTGNVYQIDIQYLGFGPITFKVEVCGSDQDSPSIVVAHTIKLPNTLAVSTFGNPAFPFSMAATSVGSTTNLQVKCASFAGFIEGQKRLHGNRFSYFNSSTTVTNAAYTSLFTIFNARVYAGRSNQAVINLVSIASATEHNNPCVLYLIKNGSLIGNPNFTSFASNSCSLVDTAATTVTFSSNDQVIWSGHIGGTGEFNITIDPSGLEELTLQPGEWITLAARSLGAGSPNFVTGSINTREDQ